MEMRERGAEDGSSEPAGSCSRAERVSLFGVKVKNLEAHIWTYSLKDTSEAPGPQRAAGNWMCRSRQAVGHRSISSTLLRRQAITGSTMAGNISWWNWSWQGGG